jgi:leader peptidase (prepilin peptidase)/N-methyltransferase
MIVLTILIFIFGTLIGSFLNVVIHRVPLDKSVVKPRSSCPKCGHMIKWYENFPIISYIFILRSKCSGCGVKIPIRYPLIELVVGLIAVALFPKFINPDSLLIFTYYFSVACILLAHFIIDLEHQLLPDKINIYFLLITIPFVAFTKSYQYWLIGGLIGFFLPLLVTWAFYKIRGKIGLGGGDIKLFGILGLILGPIGILQNIFMSCFLGSIVGLILILSGKMNKNTALAFGPYIIVVAVGQIFYPTIFEQINLFSFR